MEDQNKRIVEINGVKMEVDLRNARTTEDDPEEGEGDGEGNNLAGDEPF